MRILGFELEIKHKYFFLFYLWNFKDGWKDNNDTVSDVDEIGDNNTGNINKHTIDLPPAKTIIRIDAEDDEELNDMDSSLSQIGVRCHSKYRSYIALLFV